MTAIDTPTFIQAGGETAEETRRSLGALLGRRGGVVGATDLAVTQAGTPNMTVIVAGGQVVIPGTEATFQGFYVCENRGNETVNIAAADGTNGRFDLIVAEVRDAAYSGSNNDFRIRAVTGTPSGSPVVPSAPANSWVLARVFVGAGVSSITNANITDYRFGLASFTSQNGSAAALGGVIVCTSTTRPTVGLYEGLCAYETDTDRAIIYSGSGWVDFATIGQWTSFSTVALTQSNTVTRTVTYSRYRRVGRSVRFQCYLAVGGNGTSNNAVRISLPVTAAQNGLPVGTMYWFDQSAATNYITPATLATTTAAGGLISGTASSLGQTVAGWPNLLASGDAVLLDIEYEAAS